MTLELPALYHWSPERCSDKITRRGLRPTTPTAVWVRPWRPGRHVGHRIADLPDQTILTVCLGTSPSTAWALSGALSAERGETWDLWEIDLNPGDEVHYVPGFGPGLDEVRVANPIPRSRCWYVGSRVVAERGSRWHSRPELLKPGPPGRR